MVIDNLVSIQSDLHIVVEEDITIGTNNLSVADHQFKYGVNN